MLSEPVECCPNQLKLDGKDNERHLQIEFHSLLSAGLQSPLDASASNAAKTSQQNFL
jgi:hypothetical protein